MSLRARLVLVLGSLVALLLTAEWVLVRALTRTLDREVDAVALTVGSSLLDLFVLTDGDPGSARFVAPGAFLPIVKPRGLTTPGPGTNEDYAPRSALLRTTRLMTTGPKDGGEGELTRRFPGSTTDGDLEVTVEHWELAARETASETTSDDGDAPEAARPRPARFALRIGSREVAVHGEMSLQRTAPAEAPAGGSARGSAEGDLFEILPADTLHSTGWALAASDLPSATTAAPLRIPVPRRGLDRALETFFSRLLTGSLALFVVGLGAIAWVAHRVTRPLRGLAETAERIGQGELGAVVALQGDREVTQTLAAFNQMSVRLEALDREARQLRDREHLSELGDVARGLAHALRNPLHTLGLAVDALAAERHSDAGLAASETESNPTALAARTQLQRIDSALEGFLTLASAGGVREVAQLDDIARDVALELAQSPEPVTVRVLAESGAVPILCVPAELRAVVHALVVNAAEAAPSEPVVVRVEPIQDGARARLEVLDRGPGLAPDVRARLFTPHVTTKPHGTGMGLYLAERIARTRYRGGLALLDRPGGGVRAVLELALEGGPNGSPTGHPTGRPTGRPTGHSTDASNEPSQGPRAGDSQ